MIKWSCAADSCFVMKECAEDHAKQAVSMKGNIPIFFALYTKIITQEAIAIRLNWYCNAELLLVSTIHSL